MTNAASLRAFAAELDGRVPVIDDAVRVKRRSRDFFWYSPVLDAQLAGLAGDLLVEARGESDVVAVAAACAKHGIALTARGGGTGNYGQAVPLQGGVILDMSGLDQVEWRRGDVVRTGAGIKMNKLDDILRPDGFEQRMHPSTKRTASIGGFVAGGSGGIGSVTWGGLRERGNVRAARIVTLEREPRILELTGDDVQQVAHAYGTTGLITALEMPLAPVHPWIDVIVAFDNIMASAACGLALANDPSITKKLVTPIAWPIPQWFPALRAYCPSGQAIMIAMIAEPDLPAFRTLAAAHGGTVTFETPLDERSGSVPLYEYTWNHTTLQVLKADRGYTYLQSLHPPDRILESVAEIDALFPGELYTHLEFLEFAGRMTCAGLAVIRYTTPERLDEIMAAHEALGVAIANPHVFTLEDGTRYKRAEANQLGFKHQTDPMGLLNPGKMRTFAPGAVPA